MKGRMIFVAVLLGLGFIAVVARLYFLQVVRHDHYVELAEKQQQRVVELNPPRGTFFDRNGVKLAVSGPADSAFAVPRDVKDPYATARALAPVLDLSAVELSQKLVAAKASRRGWFVWIKRQLSRDESLAVRALELPGIGLREESKRYYPQGELAAHVVGFVGTDFHGLAGIEQSFDSEVAGKEGRRIVLRDAGGRYAVDPSLAAGEAAPEPGLDLHLTIDGTLQHLTERELARSAETYGAQAASAVLLDPRSGAILAMASYPSFDPNRFNEGANPQERWRNRVIADAFEPGSTFKIVPVSAALEANLVDPSDAFDCGMGKIVLYGVTIHDHKPFPVLSLRDVIAKSSNVGAIKVGLKVGDKRLYEQIVALGFGRKAGLELPGESPGILRPLKSWQPITKAYASFGQGIAVTPLQLAMAFAAVANGGELIKPYLVQKAGHGSELRDLHPRPEVLGRAMSASTARQVERLLEAVTMEGGTATKAAVPGYYVAGKTGTAQMADGGRYSRTDHMAVFAGIAPGRDPQLVGAVVVDRPRGDFHGGSVAAPVFGGIMKQALLYLGIRPERDPIETWPGEQRQRDLTNPLRLVQHTAPGQRPVAPAPRPASPSAGGRH